MHVLTSKTFSLCLLHKTSTGTATQRIILSEEYFFKRSRFEMCPGIRHVVLLCLLCLWAGNTVDGINHNALANMIQFIMRTVSLKSQYALAINVPRSECNKLENYQLFDNPSKVREQVRNGFYQDSKSVAVRPDYDTRTHAEYRLLQKSEGQSSLLENLLEKRGKEDSCVVFFTYYSPCVEKCTDDRHEKSILEFLHILAERDPAWTAFVFYEIYNDDIKKHSEEVIENALNQIINTAGSTVYRCTSFGSRNHCYNCSTQMDDCLYGIKQRKRKRPHSPDTF